MSTTCPSVGHAEAVRPAARVVVAVVDVREREPAIDRRRPELLPASRLVELRRERRPRSGRRSLLRRLVEQRTARRRASRVGARGASRGRRRSAPRSTTRRDRRRRGSPRATRRASRPSPGGGRCVALPHRVMSVRRELDRRAVPEVGRPLRRRRRAGCSSGSRVGTRARRRRRHARPRRRVRRTW